MSFPDLDDITDAVSDAVDAIGDAGDLIGGVLKTVAPILGTIPGFGTAFAVALYAAGALAAKDKITDAMIGTASAGMPPGIPRLAFDSATSITRDIVDGRSVLSSTIEACRRAADQAGGRPAVEAFNSGVAALRGDKIDQRVIEQGRAFALQGGGQAAATSFDAGVSIAQGKGADQVVVDVTRSYINQMGGSAALAAFDTGIALGYGKTLQEAGYVGLQTFVRGNDGMEKVLNFVEQVGRAKNLGMALQESLESDLAHDFLRAVNVGGISADVDIVLKPCIDAIRDNAALLQSPAGALAKEWGIDEAIIREAQALMRSGNGNIDEGMLTNLKKRQIGPMFDFSEHNASTNDGYAAKGRSIINSGAKWKGRLLSDIVNSNVFWIITGVLKGGVEMPHIEREQVMFEIDDAWKRGFEIAIGFCEGSWVVDAEQQRVETSLSPATKGGFTAGQEVQFNRTNPFGILTNDAIHNVTNTLAVVKPQYLKESVSTASADGAQRLVINRTNGIAMGKTVATASPSGSQTLRLSPKL
jgi:hypothetical protein